MSVVHVTCSYGATPSTRYRCKFRSGGPSLSLTVLRVQHYCAYSSVRMFNDMDQTRCPMLLYYGCTWNKKKMLERLMIDDDSGISIADFLKGMNMKLILLLCHGRRSNQKHFIGVRFFPSHNTLLPLLPLILKSLYHLNHI